jgi:hypothetical protein
MQRPEAARRQVRTRLGAGIPDAADKAFERVNEIFAKYPIVYS